MRIGDIEVEGLTYYPEAIDNEEENNLIKLCESLDFREITMRGMTARRTVVCFGFDYQYRRRSVVAVDPIPPALLAAKTRCARTASVGDSFDQVIVSRYPAGAGIGWHVDSPVFDDAILGLSLGAPARLQVRPRVARRVRRSSLHHVRSTCCVATRAASGNTGWLRILQAFGFR